MLECRWILSRLHATSAAADSGLQVYEFSATAQAVYAFWQYDVCDTFIELVKPIMRVRPPCHPAAVHMRAASSHAELHRSAISESPYLSLICVGVAPAP
jgi:valyl-tRNA synthetase